MKTIHVKKGEILQSKGELQTSIYIVISGLLRSYSIDQKGKEHIFMFAPENWLIADSHSVGTPCELFIDVLEDSEIKVLRKDKSEIDPDVTAIMKRLTVLQKRVLMLMSATALERYKHFTDTYPDIIQRVPQRMIASYLGITPEALSKVKNSEFKKK